MARSPRASRLTTLLPFMSVRRGMAHQAGLVEIQAQSLSPSTSIITFSCVILGVDCAIIERVAKLVEQYVEKVDVLVTKIYK